MNRLRRATAALSRTARVLLTPAAATVLLLGVVEYALFCAAVGAAPLGPGMLRAALPLPGFVALLCLALVALASLAAGVRAALAAEAPGDGDGRPGETARASRRSRILSWLLPALALALAPGAASLSRGAVAVRFDHVDQVARAAGILLAASLALIAALLVARGQPRRRRQGLLLPSLLLLSAGMLSAQRDLAPFLSAPLGLATSLGIATVVLAAWRRLHLALSAWRPRRTRRAGAALVVLTVALSLVGLLGFEDRADSAARVLLDASPIAASSAHAVRWLADVDGDGSAALFGGGDCREGDPTVGPFQYEIVDNGVDDNCQGGDLLASSLAGLPDVQPRRVPLRPSPVSGTAVHAARLVVVISVDAWRADRLGLLSQRSGLTPNLDALARRGAVFRAAYAQGADTDSSVRSMWTSRYPVHFGYRQLRFTPAPGLFALLAAAGWSTRAFYASERPNPVIDEVTGGAEFVPQTAAGDGASASELLSQRALSWLDAQRWGDPAHRALLWVHYFDPHLPHLPHAATAHLGDDAAGRYDQEVAWSDRAAGLLLDGMQQRGLLDAAIVVATADHGESLHEHGQVAGHAFEVYETIVRVPWILVYPGGAPRVVEPRVRLIDLVPTLTELLGLPDPVAREGRSVLPVLRGEELDARPVFCHASWQGRDRRALILGPHKLVRDNVRGTAALYDLGQDPLERHDLRARLPDVTARLEGELGAWWDARFNNVSVALGLGLSPCAGIARERRAVVPLPAGAAEALAADRARCEARLRAIWPAGAGAAP